MQQTDQNLLDRLARGDRDAFRLIYAEHARRLYAVALRVTRNYEDAEEVTQDVFMELASSAGGRQPIRSLRAWLLQVTTRRAIDALRRRAVRKDMSRSESLSDADQDHGVIGHDALPTTPPRAREAVHEAELAAAVRRLAATLPNRQQLAFNLRHYQGLSLLEIAEAMQCSEGAVKSHLHHALAKMREGLRAEGFLDHETTRRIREEEA